MAMTSATRCAPTVAIYNKVFITKRFFSLFNAILCLSEHKTFQSRRLFLLNNFVFRCHTLLRATKILLKLVHIFANAIARGRHAARFVGCRQCIKKDITFTTVLAIFTAELNGHLRDDNSMHLTTLDDSRPHKQSTDYRVLPAGVSLYGAQDRAKNMDLESKQETYLSLKSRAHHHITVLPIEYDSRNIAGI